MAAMFYIFLLSLISNFIFLLQHSSVGNSGSKKTRVWKNLKQIIATEKSQPWKPEDVTCKKIRVISHINYLKKKYSKYV